MSSSNSQNEQRNSVPQRRFVRMSQRVEPRPNNHVTIVRSNNHQIRRPVVFVIYYSMYGHVAGLASSIRTGVEHAGCDCHIFQVAETLSNETLKNMNAPPKQKNIPIIRPEQLPEADGILFGMPTHFGTAPAQMKTLFDACSNHWMSDALIGKPAGVFFSTATLGGGQETTALSCVPFFTHLGMLFVPLGYRNKSLMNLDDVHGGSPYGAGTLAGTKGERQVSQLEHQLAHVQGIEFGKVVLKLSSTPKYA
ncbi:unnamed protein product [Rotaria socialis]|uniref:Flavodoxin-like domain-containing protein n=1 Tax=Rotaria socialis TaxID=392032 RepID=A0A820BN65_9BILA|nr:unnamed protein product [Rotaria socialis]CAF3426826.1 unnamed protein product [Rotaria socialis]CAF3483743.1 unnamed protein product [Rotaria socialis]CAF3485436.1 unnamed protein product [Rotaria socialis]CAF3505412.1 unnamed protein product [Rotaria socialis]